MMAQIKNQRNPLICVNLRFRQLKQKLPQRRHRLMRRFAAAQDDKLLTRMRQFTPRLLD
jgi:hypothetical protein